jgi:hypothetical protein
MYTNSSNNNQKITSRNGQLWGATRELIYLKQFFVLKIDFNGRKQKLLAETEYKKA